MKKFLKITAELMHAFVELAFTFKKLISLQYCINV